MAHFALISEDGIIEMVVVINNDDITLPDGSESESLGIELCNKLIQEGKWVQTSYTNRIRRRFAGIGMHYVNDHDCFALPKPYESWIFDPTDEDDWVAPKHKPVDDAYHYVWNESTIDWDAYTKPSKPNVFVLEG